MINRFFHTTILIICFAILLPSFHTVFAQGNFLVDYNIFYAVDESGKTGVTQNISLTNNRTDLYAKEYSIIIDSTQVKNVRAKDTIGTINPEIKTKDDKTEIRLQFNDEVVGLGKKLDFQLTYDDDNIAKKNGQIWEVNLPGVRNDDTLGTYDIKLTVPSSFGPAAYMFPPPEKGLMWSKGELINGGVTAAFGKKQLVELTLSYFLENTRASSSQVTIALPPTTAFQKVIIQSIDPPPDKIVPDTDGNWLAHFTMQKESQLTVTANVLVELYLKKRDVTYPISKEKRSEYVKPTSFWQTDDSELKKLALNLKTPRAIYDFVVTTLSYDYDRVTQTILRRGAIDALKNPNSAVCMEFTDLFITLARAAGIPARQAVGYAHTTNAKLRPLSLVSDVLHAWPEYYDDNNQTWTPIDPTWANTTGGLDYFDKLDFNHVVFAYNGLDDSYPYPAGFYKKAGTQGKAVSLRFVSETIPSVDPKISVSFETPGKIVAGFASQGVAVLSNASSVAAEGVFVSLESSLFSPAFSRFVPVIPPYGQLAISFPLYSSNFFTLGKSAVYASVDGQVTKYELDIIPAYHVIVPVVLAIIWSVILIVIIYKRKHIWKK